MLPAAAAAMKHFLVPHVGPVYWFAPGFSASGRPANYGWWTVYFSQMSMCQIGRDGIYRVGILEHFTQIKTNTKTIDI